VSRRLQRGGKAEQNACQHPVSTVTAIVNATTRVFTSLVKQTTEWRGPARFDQASSRVPQVLDDRVHGR
jgi:hypothetical protein